MRTYEDLIIWQKAHYLALTILKECKNFPKTDEARIIKQQLIRSSSSIPANIVEGYGGYSKKGYLAFLNISRKSSNETDYWLRYAFDVGFLQNGRYVELKAKTRECIALLTSTINTVKAREQGTGSKE